MAQRRGPDGTVRVAVSGNTFGEPWANVFWLNTAGWQTATQANFDALVANAGEAYYSSLGPQLATSVNITLAVGTLFTPGDTAMHSSHVMTHTGVQTGAIVQNLATCPVLSWTSTVYWRGGKPRTYLPSLLQSETQGDRNLTAAAVTGYKNAGNALHTALNGLSSGPINQVQHGFVSFMSGGVDRNPSVFFPITGCNVHARYGTQRRRLGPWVA